MIQVRVRVQFSVIFADRLLRARDRVALPDRHDSLLVVQDEPGRGSRSRRPAPGTVPCPSRGRLKFNLFFFILQKPHIHLRVEVVLQPTAL